MIKLDLDTLFLQKKYMVKYWRFFIASYNNCPMLSLNMKQTCQTQFYFLSLIQEGRTSLPLSLFPLHLSVGKYSFLTLGTRPG